MSRLLAAVLVFAGCAAAPMRTPATREARNVRAELSQLEARVAVLMRDEIAPLSVEKRTSQRCARVEAAAAEICDAAERICRLADELADEPAARSCTRARNDCRHAHEIATSCR